MKEKIVIIDGLRSPISKAGFELKNIQADTLGAIITKELVLRTGISYDAFDEIIL